MSNEAYRQKITVDKQMQMAMELSDHNATEPDDTSLSNKAIATRPVGDESIANESIAEVDDWQCLHPNYVSAERLGGMIFVGVLSCVLLIAWLVVMFAVFSLTDSRSWFIALAAAAFCGLLAYWGWFHPQWNFSATRWREIHRGFEIRRGIWWKHRIFIPRERIQHTDVVRGPIMRRFGIAKLIIYTAGTHNHEISLEGLGAEQAESLRQSLLPRSEPPALDTSMDGDSARE